MLLGQMLEDRNILARGLAHPVTFMSGSSELRGRVPGLLQDNGQNQFTSDFQDFGAVPVTPRNFYRLLQSAARARLTVLELVTVALRFLLDLVWRLLEICRVDQIT